MGRPTQALLRACVLLAAAVAACGPTVRPSMPNATTPASPGGSTPISTLVITSEPSTAAIPRTAGLVIHLTTFGHTGSFGPGTTILDDGRIIWYDNAGGAIESRLAPKELQQVQAALEGNGVLDRTAAYFAELRPGAQPPGHGVNGYRFDVVRDGVSIVVDAQDPRSFAGEAEFWVIPPEMNALADIADHLADPVAWLGPDAFFEPTRAYRADWFLVEIHLYRSGTSGTEPDVDAVRWPFGEPIERVGAAYDSGSGGPESRCLIIDAGLASLTVAAEQATGIQRDLREWGSSIDYEWPRAQGFVTVTLTHLLPYETGSCAELATTPP